MPPGRSAAICVSVTALMGPGVDPHAYRQTRSDIVRDRAGRSRAVGTAFTLEAQLEEFLLDVAETRPVVAVAEAIAPTQLIGSEDYEGRFDPHVWMNPNLWSRVVLATRDAMIAVDPDNAATFTANAAAHLDELADLAVYSQTVLASVPAESRVLVTAHDAFNYFGLPPTASRWWASRALSTESEAGLQRIAELVDMLVARGIGAVFVETSVSDRNIRALIEGAARAGPRGRSSAESCSPDALGAPGTYEGTYLGMIDHNVTVDLARAGWRGAERGRVDELAMN